MNNRNLGMGIQRVLMYSEVKGTLSKPNAIQTLENIKALFTSIYSLLILRHNSLF